MIGRMTTGRAGSKCKNPHGGCALIHVLEDVKTFVQTLVTQPVINWLDDFRWAPSPHCWVCVESRFDMCGLLRRDVAPPVPSEEKFRLNRATKLAALPMLDGRSLVEYRLTLACGAHSNRGRDEPVCMKTLDLHRKMERQLQSMATLTRRLNPRTLREFF